MSIKVEDVHPMAGMAMRAIELEKFRNPFGSKTGMFLLWY